jgi:hypothetical protein
MIKPSLQLFRKSFNGFNSIRNPQESFERFRLHLARSDRVPTVSSISQRIQLPKTQLNRSELIHPFQSTSKLFQAFSKHSKLPQQSKIIIQPVIFSSPAVSPEKKNPHHILQRLITSRTKKGSHQHHPTLQIAKKCHQN